VCWSPGTQTPRAGVRPDALPYDDTSPPAAMAAPAVAERAMKVRRVERLAID
jgi:hypothetical protein